MAPPWGTIFYHSLLCVVKYGGGGRGIATSDSGSRSSQPGKSEQVVLAYQPSEEESEAVSHSSSKPNCWSSALAILAAKAGWNRPLFLSQIENMVMVCKKKSPKLLDLNQSQKKYRMPKIHPLQESSKYFTITYRNITCTFILTQACESHLRLPPSSPPLNQLKQPVCYLGRSWSHMWKQF